MNNIMRLGAAVVLLLATPLPLSGAHALDGSGQWAGLIVCERGGDRFESERRFEISGREMTWERGTPGEDGYETLAGTIDDTGEVMLHGRYHWDREKTFWMKGRFQENRFDAQGERGRKWCSLTLTRES